MWLTLSSFATAMPGRPAESVTGPTRSTPGIRAATAYSAARCSGEALVSRRRVAHEHEHLVVLPVAVSRRVGLEPGEETVGVCGQVERPRSGERLRGVRGWTGERWSAGRDPGVS